MDFASKFVLADEEDEVEEVAEDEMRSGWAVSNPVVETSDDDDVTVTPATAAAAAAPAAAPAAVPFFSRLFGSLSTPAPAAAAAASAASAAGPATEGAAAVASAAAPPPPPPLPKPRVRFNTREKTGRTYRQGVSTNVFAVRLSHLKDDVPFHTGDAIFCKLCRVTLSKCSKVEEKKWKCEFCNTVNDVDIEMEEIPCEESVDYILRPPDEVKDDEAHIVFCMDTSGSMCVSTEVQGVHQLRDGSLQRLNSSLGSFREGPQWLPGQQRNVTYVSRLQSLQGAVQKQIDSMSTRNPKRHISLVSFNNEVTIHGDCCTSSEVISGDHLSNKEYLLQKGSNTECVKTPVSHAKDKLSEKLFSLEEGGQTALGPALLVSIAIASSRPGSQVIVCTDGLANVGLGSLENVAEEDREKAESFYDEMATLAREKGVTVSILTVEGQECRLEKLGLIADVTGGQIERVNPLNMEENFQAMLAKTIIATNVSVTMILHTSLFFKSEADERTSISQEMGSVTEDSEVLYEYGVKKTALGSDVPFQVQIRFTKPNGMQCMRTVTKLQPITHKKEEARQDLDIAVCSANAAQRSARLAQNGDYESARVNAFAWRSMLGRHVSDRNEQVESFHKFNSAMESLDMNLQQAQASESISLQDATLEERSKSRRTVRSDAQAKSIFSTKKSASKNFK